MPPVAVRRWIDSSPSTLSRSAATARATTSIVSTPSRYCVTTTPDRMVCSALLEELRVDAERARLGLVDVEPHRLGELVPVEVDVARVGIGLEDLADLLGDGADLLRVLAQHAEHHRVGDRRAVLQPLHAGAHRLEVFLEQRVERGHDPLARVEVLGHDDDLAEVRVGELGHRRQVEARRARADIRGVVRDVVALGASHCSSFFTSASVAA